MRNILRVVACPAGEVKRSVAGVDLFRCESAVLRAYWVLVVMDQCTRRIVGFGVHRGVVGLVRFDGNTWTAPSSGRPTTWSVSSSSSALL
jgi:hypothetical protein